MAALARDPYLLLGCKSGTLRVAAFADSEGVLARVPQATARLQLIPYRGG